MQQKLDKTGFVRDEMEIALPCSRFRSHVGGLLLREADVRLGLLKRLAQCFRDRRNPDGVEHRAGTLLAQWV